VEKATFKIIVKGVCRREGDESDIPEQDIELFIRERGFVVGYRTGRVTWSRSYSLKV